MPKKKRPVETIKIEGLTPESVKEFEPKEDIDREDELWEMYFKGSPNLFKLPPSQEEKTEETQDKVVLNQEIKESTPVRKTVGKVKTKENQASEEYISLDSTHTAMEAKVYSVIYRETIVKGSEPQHFGALRLMKLTGIGSDKTIRRAIGGLIAKKSIVLIDPCPNHPLGPIHSALPPKEIFLERKRAGISIHPQTKKIIKPNEPTGVSTGVRTGVTPVRSTGVTPVRSTGVTPVRSTGVPENIPYIYLNYINYDDDSEKTESSSSNYLEKKDENNTTFDHKFHTIFLYEKYTDKGWKIDDDEFYENIKDVLPDIIEAAIIASVLRSNTGVNSLAHCGETVKEFQEKLPPGYVSYLRSRWEERKGRGKIEDDCISDLCLPKDSYFQEEWLKNYLSGFSKDERPRIKRLAEQFDHFMLTPGKKREWVKNPTGTFIGLVRGEVNVSLSKHAPGFESRVEEEKRIEQERLEREEEQQRREELEKEIRGAMSELRGEDREKFIREAKSKYSLSRLGDEESILDSVVYHILYDLEQRGDEDWRKIWKEIIGESVLNPKA